MYFQVENNENNKEKKKMKITENNGPEKVNIIITIYIDRFI
jgi:hypothetical protein